MPASGYYTNVFQPVLQRRFDTFAALDDVLDMSEEMALLRVYASDAVALYAQACEDGKGILEIGEMLAERIERVSKHALSMSKIQSMKQDRITQDALNVILRQITQAAYEAFGPESEDTKQFVSAISGMIESPLEVKPIDTNRLVELMVQTVPTKLPTNGNRLRPEDPSGNGNGNGNGNGHKGNGTSGNGNGHAT